MRSRLGILFALSALGFGSFFGSVAASAYESRLEIDPALKPADLDHLRASGEVVARTWKTNGTFYADASAVVAGADVEKLKAASLDFDRYAQMGMPAVKDCKVVERKGDYLYNWNHLNQFGIVSKHYLEVHVLPVGSEWELAQRRPAWPYAQDTTFTRLDGSWFMQALPDGKGVYLRYFVASVMDLGFLESVVEGQVKKQMGDGVKAMVQILAKEAAAKP